MNSETKICQNCKQEFTIEPDDLGFYEKMQVPPPTWCPECRMIRRFMFRNEKNLFRRPDDASGKEIFSSYPAAVATKIYDHDYWWSDNWDAMQYGREYDFSKPFFEQFRELLNSVPWPSRSILRLVNSEYSDNASDLKNAYLCFDSNKVENSAYVVRGDVVKEGFDLYESRHSELSYESYMVDEAYRVFFSVNCEDCVDVWFSKDMIGCQNCFGCANLRGKSYYIFNKPYSKEDYKEFLSKIDLGSHKAIDELKVRVRDLWSKYPVRFTLAINTTNSTGEHIERTKNVKLGYSIHECENIAYSQFLTPTATDCYDYTLWGEGSSKMYECLICGEQCSNLKFCFECWPGCRDLEYAAFCRSSSDLFGCVGLNKKQYCIFNKQYTKEEYAALREKIIRHMDEMPYISEIRNQTSEARKIVYKYGEFFPPEFSPFAYNETIAQDFFPLTEAEAKDQGVPWRELERREYETTVNASDLPDNIKNIDDLILKEIIKCASCSRAYRIIQMELQFYRRIGLPLPRLCHNCRFNERFKFVNPPKWRHAKCQCAGSTLQSNLGQASSPQASAIDDRKLYQNQVKHFHGDDYCPNEFETSYPPDRPDIIYCEQCYKVEVY